MSAKSLTWMKARSDDDQQSRIVYIYGPAGWTKAGELVTTPLTVSEARGLAVELLIAAERIERRAQ